MNNGKIENPKSPSKQQYRHIKVSTKCVFQNLQEQTQTKSNILFFGSLHIQKEIKILFIDIKNQILDGQGKLNSEPTMS